MIGQLTNPLLPMVVLVWSSSCTARPCPRCSGVNKHVYFGLCLFLRRVREVSEPSHTSTANAFLLGAREHVNWPTPPLLLISPPASFPKKVNSTNPLLSLPSSYPLPSPPVGVTNTEKTATEAKYHPTARQNRLERRPKSHSDALDT